MVNPHDGQVPRPLRTAIQLNYPSENVKFSPRKWGSTASRIAWPFDAAVYGPDVTIKHNLVIEPEADVPFDPTRNYVCHLGAGPQPGLTVDNNLVFRTWAEAGLVDTKTFMPSRKSPARGAATGRIGYITKDHYNHDRYVGAAADVGAVQNTAE